MNWERKNMSLLSNWRILHKGCDGQVIKRTCSKCKRHWAYLESWVTLDWYHQKIRKSPTSSQSPRKLTGNPITDALPNWPRWARITSTLGITLIIVGIILYVF